MRGYGKNRGKSAFREFFGFLSAIRKYGRRSRVCWCFFWCLPPWCCWCVRVCVRRVCVYLCICKGEIVTNRFFFYFLYHQQQQQQPTNTNTRFFEKNPKIQISRKYRIPIVFRFASVSKKNIITKKGKDGG